MVMDTETKKYAEQIVDLVKAAVEAEREACAVIAQKHGEFCHREARNGGSIDLHERGDGAIHIAALIRSRHGSQARKEG